MSRDARLIEILCLLEDSGIRESRSFWNEVEENLDLSRFGSQLDRSEVLKVVNRYIVDQERKTEAILSDDTCSYKRYFENAFQFLLRQDNEFNDELNEVIESGDIDVLKGELFEMGLLEVFDCAFELGLVFSSTQENEDKEILRTNKRAREMIVEYMFRNESCFDENIRDVLAKLRRNE